MTYEKRNGIYNVHATGSRDRSPVALSSTPGFTICCVTTQSIELESSTSQRIK